MFSALLTRLATFRRNRTGVAAVEMAVVTPFVLLLALGGTALPVTSSQRRR
jgi:Flp pilus assembly protein TadG